MTMPEGNLLSSFQVHKSKAPWCVIGKVHTWQILSGHWSAESEASARINGDGEENFGESLAIIGSGNWGDLELRVKFRFKSDTIRPPEGGAIVFFLFKNVRNHLAYHFCIYKKKVKLFKKLRGIWSLLGEQCYAFELYRDYDVVIRSRSGWHECSIDGGDPMGIHDNALRHGCIGIGGKFCDVVFSQVRVSTT